MVYGIFLNRGFLEGLEALGLQGFGSSWAIKFRVWGLLGSC